MTLELNRTSRIEIDKAFLLNSKGLSVRAMEQTHWPPVYQSLPLRTKEDLQMELSKGKLLVIMHGYVLNETIMYDGIRVEHTFFRVYLAKMQHMILLLKSTYRLNKQKL